MNPPRPLRHTALALSLLGVGFLMGLGVESASASPDPAAALRALEQRLAALEAVVVIRADGVTIGHRDAHLALRRGGLELSGKTVLVNGVDKATLLSGGQARLEMVKAGDVALNGRRIEIKGSQDVQVKGRKIAHN
jgi:hypothetical protein